MYPPGDRPAEKGKAVARPLLPRPESRSGSQTPVPDYSRLLGNMQSTPQQSSEANQSGQPVAPTNWYGPNSETIGEWNNLNTKFPLCPSEVPLLWRQWWFRPVCGGPQSRVRYELALQNWSKITTPLPYEEQEQYIHRLLDNVDYIFGEYHRNLANEDWQKFNRDYEPWRPVKGDMLPSSLNPLAKEEEAGLQDCDSRGLKWNYIHKWLPGRPEAEVLVQYVKLVADGFGERTIQQETSDELSEFWEDLCEEYDMRLNRHAWEQYELDVLVALRGYGLTYFAIAEEFVRRDSDELEDVYKAEVQRRGGIPGQGQPTGPSSQLSFSWRPVEPYSQSQHPSQYGSPEAAQAPPSNPYFAGGYIQAGGQRSGSPGPNTGSISQRSGPNFARGYAQPSGRRSESPGSNPGSTSQRGGQTQLPNTRGGASSSQGSNSGSASQRGANHGGSSVYGGHSSFQSNKRCRE